MTIPVAFPFVGNSIGGSHISASLLMRHLPEQGFAPVALLHGGGALADWLAARELPVMRTALPYLAPGSGGAAALLRLAAIAPGLALFLRRNGFALVHSHDGRSSTTWLPAGRLAGMKTIAHQRTRWNPSRLALRTAAMANTILAISDYVRDTMPAALIGRTRVVANPFDLSAPDRTSARAAGLALTGEATAVIGFVGTLQAQKRPDIFLRAAVLIRAARPGLRFLMIGRDGEHGAATRALCGELGLSDVVTFAGFRADAVQLLAGCDLLLAPAVNEGQGRAIIEAMICGTPVVAADSGGQSGIVQNGRTGLLVPSDNAGGLAAAALAILDRADHGRALADAAAAWVQSAFSPAAHAAAVAMEYRKLLSR